ncbi:MAG: ABC transporter permease [Burkholderiaceae bacterium]|jgi:sulfonate transport system permease protein|nr:ABC transporter permease [Burkholderiaceae bacterium]
MPEPASRWSAKGLVLPLIVVAAWLAVVDSGWQSNPLLVPLKKIVLAPFVDEQGQRVWLALGGSVLRASAGFLIGSLLGIALGALAGASRTSRALLSPGLHGLRQVALFAWIPLLTAWFGNGEAAKIIFIALATFFPVFLNTERGVQTIPTALKEVARVHGLGRWRTLRRLTLPGALPSIVTGLELALMIAWIGTVGSEYAMGAGRGLGAYLATARDVFRMDLVIAGVLILALSSYALSRLALHAFARLTQTLRA